VTVFISASSPKQAKTENSQQHAKAASQTPAAVQQPNSPHNQTSQGCPGTKETRFDCNTVATIANLRQADAAERFNNLAGVEVCIGAATAVAAILAARWAKHAAEAATKSFRAFVAAEDAHLVLDFAQGPIGRRANSEGVDKTNYSFKITISNVGRSAARLHQIIISNSDGSMARSFGETLKADASTELPDWLLITADDPKANVSVGYATSLHPLTNFEAVVGMDVHVGERAATAYVISSRLGRPKTK
jgi:hypothetical protein